MTIEEIEAVMVDLPDQQLNALFGRVMAKRIIESDVDPLVLEEARRRLDDMKSGRVAPVPFKQLLDDLKSLAS